MKAHLFFLFFLSWSLTIYSQIYMNIKSKDGTTQSFNIEDIRKLTFDGVVNVEDGEKLSTVIKTFTLLQNYPNPFNPSTTIEYKIPEAGNVEVKVYDINGRLVKELEKDFRNPGQYKIEWNSRNNLGHQVASGIYMVQVRHNKTALTKKIMLIK